MSVAIYHMDAGINLLTVHEKQMTEDLTHLLVKQQRIMLLLPDG